MDLDVSLPHLFIPEAMAAGLEMDLRLEIETAGPGVHRARYIVVDALADMGLMVDVEDLGTGYTSITVTPDRWITGRIGPLRIGVASFELLLDGAPEAGGRRVSGEAFESQTALSGTFDGWARHRFLLATTDLSAAGRVTEVALVRESEIRVRPDLTPVSPDPFLRRSGRQVFVLNRLTFDNLQGLDPDSDFATSWQLSVGVGANPHDVAVVPDGRIFVSRYEPPFNDLAILAEGGGEIVGTVPLASLAENQDGTPRADHLAVIDGMVFVGLQDIDRTFTRFAEGKLAVVDPALNASVGVIPLGGRNPGSMEVVLEAGGEQRLYVAMAGIFPGLQPQELSGGVMVVDPVNRVVERVALDDDVAGGNIGALAMVSPDLGYVVASDAAFVNRVLAFDPVGGTIRRVLLETTQFIPEVEVDTGGVLALPDTTFNRPRLCLYRVPVDPAQPESDLGCVNLDLMPFSLEALD
jgi:DNA-binding beta-propeller fold protein YncE